MALNEGATPASEPSAGMALAQWSPLQREAAMTGPGPCRCGRWNCPGCSGRSKWRLYVSTHQNSRFIALVDPNTTVAELIGEPLISLVCRSCLARFSFCGFAARAVAPFCLDDILLRWILPLLCPLGVCRGPPDETCRGPSAVDASYRRCRHHGENLAL